MIIQTFFGSFKPPIAVDGIAVDTAALTLKTGESGNFTVTVTPQDATNKRYTVTSSNPQLVTVVRTSGDTWTVTAAENPEQGGDATITITSKADPAKTATVKVTVRIPVASITADKTSIQGDTKTTADITFTVLPENATDKTITVTSSNPQFATVAHKSGTTYTATFVKGGEGTITATSKSDPSVIAGVAFTSIQTGPTDNEKAKYYADNLAKAKAGTYTGKEIKPGAELLECWDPWGDTGKTTGAEIVAAIAKAGDANMNSIIPGDWFNVTAGGTTYKYVCNGRDQYYIAGSATNGKHHFTFVPDRMHPTQMAYDAQNSNDWGGSDLKTWMEGTFYNSLPAAVRNSIVTLNLPFTDYNGSRKSVSSRVFPPSEIEAFGKQTYSAESAGGSPANNAYTVLSRTDATRKRTGTTNNWYWLRSSYSGDTYYVPVVDSGGAAYYGNARVTYGGALPCFNLG